MPSYQAEQNRIIRERRREKQVEERQQLKLIKLAEQINRVVISEYDDLDNKDCERLEESLRLVRSLIKYRVYVPAVREK